MPQKLVRERFEFMFCCKGQLRFSDVIAYHLDPNNPDRLLYSPKESGERELALARCTRFNNQHLVSLAQQFGVSDSAMAIRLKELELVGGLRAGRAFWLYLERAVGGSCWIAQRGTLFWVNKKGPSRGP